MIELRRHAFPPAALIALLLFAPDAPAWGPDGHRIVADIAAAGLTPEAKAAVAVLLGDKTLADVSTWADEIKSDPRYEWAYPLHYANVPPDADAFDLSRDCPKQGCVVSAILRFSDELRNAADREARAEALKFLVHFVADIHQPLHVGRAADRGGNDILVRFFGVSDDLHAVWDEHILGRATDNWRAYAVTLRESITPRQRNGWRCDDVCRWATESCCLAATVGYAVPEDRRLDDDYYARALPVVNERLSMAGVRLADLLNALLTPATRPAASQPTSRPTSGPTCSVLSNGRP